MNKNDIIYYARIIPNVDIYELRELIIRTSEENWFVGIDRKDKHTYLFSNNDIGKTVFANRTEALNKVKEAEKNKKEQKEEI